MFREQQFVLPVEIAVQSLEFLFQQIFLEQLLFYPDRHRHAKGIESPRCKCQVGFEESLEFEKGLVVKHDKVDVVQSDTCLAEAVFDRVVREPRIMLFARKPLLLRRCNNAAVVYQSRRTIMIKRRYT